MVNNAEQRCRLIKMSI